MSGQYCIGSNDLQMYPRWKKKIAFEDVWLLAHRICRRLWPPVAGGPSYLRLVTVTPKNSAPLVWYDLVLDKVAHLHIFYHVCDANELKFTRVKWKSRRNERVTQQINDRGHVHHNKHNKAENTKAVNFSS